MTFEEKKNRAFEESIYSCIPDENVTETIRGAFDLAWDRARQETLREVKDDIRHIKSGLYALKERDLGALGIYEYCRDVLKKLEAEREG